MHNSRQCDSHPTIRSFDHDSDGSNQSTAGRKKLWPVVTMLVIGAGLWAPTSANAGIVFTGLFSGMFYEQTSATDVSFSGSTLSLQLNTAAAGDFDSASVLIPTAPTATQVPLTYSPTLDGSGTYRSGTVSSYFAGGSGNVSPSLAAQTAVYPKGIYTFTAVNSTTLVSQSATLNYDSNYWPAAYSPLNLPVANAGGTAIPALTSASFVGLQGMNASAAQTINFNTFVGNGVPVPGEVDPSTSLSIFTTQGQLVYVSQPLASGTESLQLPANTLAASTPYVYQLDFDNGLHCGVGLSLCGTNDPIGYFLNFAVFTSGEFTTGAVSTGPPVSLNLQGGTLANPVPLQSQGQIGQVNGLIGGYGAMDFYLFNWIGGDFQANASLTGANSNATYQFELLDQFGNLLEDIELDAADYFTADLGALLSTGKYEIGLLADNPLDPAYTISFITPVSGVPEPATLGLMVFGLIGLGLSRRRAKQHIKSYFLSIMHCETSMQE